MKHQVIIKFAILCFVVIGSLQASGQIDSLCVEKKSCVSPNSTQKGYKIYLQYSTDSGRVGTNLFYGLDRFINLSDSLKLVFVGKLLGYENDTQKCCLLVSGYKHNQIDGWCGSPKFKAYNISVDALFMINRLCFSSYTDMYSCTPVLYDKQLRKEINSDQKKIKVVFAAYKKWYAECKAKGMIPKYFPFNDGRYVWYGGRKSIAPKD